MTGVLLLLLLLAVGVGAAVVSIRGRPSHTIESGISSFRREMRALAPPDRRDREQVPGEAALHPDPPHVEPQHPDDPPLPEGGPS